jgi:transglutaminase-like putative cysteine protease
MDTNADTTTTSHVMRWPAITVFIVQLGMQWILAQQFVVAGWVDGSDFLSPLAAIAVVTTAIAVWVWRTDHFAVYFGVGGIGTVALLHWMTPIVQAEIAQTLGDTYVARINGWGDICYEIILHGIAWWHNIQAGQASNDAVMFVVVLAILTYLLAVVSTWVLLRTHAVWLSLGISALPLLLNYAFAPQHDAKSIGVYVGCALALVALNQIHWHEVTWRDNRVAHPRQISIQLLGQAIVIIGVAVALAALLPIPARDTRVVAGWNAVRTPLKSLQQAWGWVLGSGKNPPPTTGSNGGFANTSMTVGGARNLSQTEVLRVRTDAADYLRATTFDGYTGQGWIQQADTRDTPVASDNALTSNLPTESLTQSEITLAMPQTTGILMSIGQPVQYSIAVTVTQLADVAGSADGIVAIRGGAVQQYQLMSSTYTASADELRNATAPYESIGAVYTALPSTLPPQIRDYANAIVATAQATTAYDQAIAIQTTLRTLQYDEQRPAPPETSDWVEYFLFTSQRGYCDDFATAILCTLRAGGDNAGRAAMIGAWLGASLGLEGIPEEWLNKLTQRPRIEAAIKQWFEKLIEKA